MFIASYVHRISLVGILFAYECLPFSPLCLCVFATRANPLHCKGYIKHLTSACLPGRDISVAERLISSQN